MSFGKKNTKVQHVYSRHLAALQQELKFILAQKLVNAFLSIMAWVLSLVKQLKLVMMSRFIMV